MLLVILLLRADREASCILSEQCSHLEYDPLLTVLARNGNPAIVSWRPFVGGWAMFGGQE
jgi:hypothetical protein